MKKINLFLAALLLFSWILLFVIYKQKNNLISLEKQSIINTDSKKVKKDTSMFIKYWNLDNENQIPYKTRILQTAKIKLFPNFQTRNNLNINEIDNVFGINQFFMDFDMTTGYVHEFTKNFYKKLRSDDYVLILERDKTFINEGTIQYKKVKHLSSRDKLGQNIGFFRQWKLSEIDINENKSANFKKDGQFFFLQVNKNSNNPFKKYIPLWSKSPKKDGYVDFKQLSKLSDFDGGTVVIIWEKNNKSYFIDLHSSVGDILENLFYIKKKFNVDPVLGIYDAGPMARKFKSDNKGKVFFDKISDKISHISYVGAGFAYKLNQ